MFKNYLQNEQMSLWEFPEYFKFCVYVIYTYLKWNGKIRYTILLKIRSTEQTSWISYVCNKLCIMYRYLK